MARQEESCWRCGTQWASEDEPAPRLTLVAGGADASLDTERWTSEGGSVAAEAVAPAR
jgi:hypothetical protein